jgi:ankyrin repeat protein
MLLIMKVKFIAAAALLTTVLFSTTSCEMSSLEDADLEELRDDFPDESVRKLAIAAAEGAVADIKDIVASGVDVNATGKFGDTPLSIAIQFNQPSSVGTLLDLGADPNRVPEGRRRSPLSIAAGLPDTAVLALLLERGADPNVSAVERAAPIVEQADAGDLAAVRLLVNAGADVDGRGLNDDTALIAAARRAHYDVVLYLLESGADYTLVNRSDESLIQIIENRIYRNTNPAIDYREEVVNFLRAAGEEVQPYE